MAAMHDDAEGALAAQSLISRLHHALDDDDLDLLDRCAEQWSSLVSDDAVSGAAWQRLLLAHPVAAAVRKEREAAVLYLVDVKGLRLSPPCERPCSCAVCRSLEADLRFRQLYARRVLEPMTAWSYVRAACAGDPVAFCLDAWQAIGRAQAFADADLLLSLRQRLEACVVQCLDATINEREVAVMLSGGGPGPLAQLSRLISAGMRRAVAHPAVQALLTTDWRHGEQFDSGRLSQPLAVLYQVAVYLCLVPLAVVCPLRRLVRHLKSPTTVYGNEAVSYWVFLLLISATFFYDDDANHYVICQSSFRFHHYALVVLILSRVVHTCNGLWHFGRQLFVSPYEVLQCISSFLYATGVSALVVANHVVPTKPSVRRVCTVLAHALSPVKNVSDQQALDALLARPVTQCQATEAFYRLGPAYTQFINDAIEPHNLAAFCFAVGHLFYYLSAGKVLYMSRMVAHLNIAVTKMIGDVIRWGLLMMLFYFAWALAMVSLYRNYRCDSKTFGSMQNSLLEMFWVVFGMTGTTDYALHGRLTRMNHPATEAVKYTGLVLYGSYCVIAQIVLVNLLIALMSVTFQKIEDDRVTAMTFWRSKVQVKFIKWHKQAILPSPFNLLYPVFWASRAIWRRLCPKYFCSVDMYASRCSEMQDRGDQHQTVLEILNRQL